MVPLPSVDRERVGDRFASDSFVERHLERGFATRVKGDGEGPREAGVVFADEQSGGEAG